MVSSSCNITLLYKSTGRLQHINSKWDSVSVSHTFLAKCMYIEICVLWYCVPREGKADREWREERVIYFLPSRTQMTQERLVQALLETSHSTGSDSRLGLLLWIRRMCPLLGAPLGDVVIPLSHPQILPQAMTVCQWLLRMWWEWDLQKHVQHNPSVSWIYDFYFDN